MARAGKRYSTAKRRPWSTPHVTHVPVALEMSATFAGEGGLQVGFLHRVKHEEVFDDIKLKPGARRTYDYVLKIAEEMAAQGVEEHQSEFINAVLDRLDELTLRTPGDWWIKQHIPPIYKRAKAR